MTSYERQVLVTGGAGFIGSNLLCVLTHKYPTFLFICIDKLNYAATDITKLASSNFIFIEQDLTNYKQLSETLNKYDITDIINLAAESCVDRSFEDPLYFTTNNILSTQSILEYIRGHPHIRFVHISTDEVYGEQIDTRVDENDRLNPTNPYSATKASIDLIIRSYEYSFGLKTTIIRSNNVYGPNQFPEKIIPMAIHNLNQGKKVQIHGDGHHRRSFLYVTDFIAAVELVWMNNLLGIFNVGSPYEMSNLDVVKLIIQLYKKPGDPSKYIEFVKDRNYNDNRYLIEYDRLTKAGWTPKIDLKNGLDTIINE